MSIYAIGDVQGCFTELEELLERLQIQDSDQIYFLGDIINRGPQSLKTLRFIKAQPNMHLLLGNHDIHTLACYQNVRQMGPKDTIAEIFKADDSEELMDYLRHSPLMYYLAKHKTVLVHAGIYPLWSLQHAQDCAHEVEQALQGPHYKAFLAEVFGNEPCQYAHSLKPIAKARFIINAFTRMRCVDQDAQLDFSYNGTLENMPPHLMPWYQYPKQKVSENIIFGHWAALDGQSNDTRAISIDTGCVWGNRLTAYQIA